MIFAGFIGNVLDSLGKLICTCFETLTAKLSIKIAEANAKIQAVTPSDDQHHIAAIGFQMPEEEEVYEDDV